MLRMMLVFHILMVEVIITQVLQRWTQMVQFGREKLFMMVRFTEKKNIKKMPTISKNMEPNKRMSLTPESHTHQLLSN